MKTISKKQIKQLDKGETTVRELFPEVFENKLEVGRWYFNKWKDTLCFIDNLKSGIYYGFHAGRYGTWNFSKEHSFVGAILATEEEVFKALEKEAIKRGLVNGAIIKNHQGIFKLENIKRHYTEKHNNGIWCESDNNDTGIWLMMNGKWAEIVETITKSEAEKQLGKLIID